MHAHDQIGYEAGPADLVVPTADTAEDPPISSDEFARKLHDALRDPAGVAIAVAGRNGERVQLNYPLNEWETGEAEVAQTIAAEVVEHEMIGFVTTFPRATGARYGEVTLTLKWRPRFPTGTDPRQG